MTEIYDNLKPEEIADIEKNWGTTLPQLKKLAAEHDERVRLESIPAEDRRLAQQGKVLENMGFEQIIGMTNVKRRKPIEFQDEDPFALKPEQLVNIMPKQSQDVI